MLFLLWEAGDSTPTLRQGSYGAGRGWGEERDTWVPVLFREPPGLHGGPLLPGQRAPLGLGEAGALSLAGPAEMQVCFSEAFAFCWSKVSSWPETVSVLFAHVPAWFLACDIF